jgi:uncharacterized caspase-like protein
MGRLGRIFGRALAFACCALAATIVARDVGAQSEQRLALVIGNSAYRTVEPLANPVRDAALIADALRKSDFKVEVLTDLDQTAMKRAMIQFGRTLRTSNAVGVFYYAGHGLQIGGRNYLVPVTANIQDETEVGIESVGLDEFLQTLDRSTNRANIVILDACRNNPFEKSFQNSATGLAAADAPKGSFVAFATAPGTVASDGTGQNSPYTAALAKAINVSGLTIEQVFKQTRREVLAETRGKQVPWEVSSIIDEIRFRAGAGQAVAQAQNDDETTLWSAVSGSGNRAALDAYLAQFPNGRNAAQARNEINQIAQREAAAAVRVAAVQTTAVPTVTRQLTMRSAAPRYTPIFPTSGTAVIPEADLKRLDCEPLWRARNEMFHRHNYCFETARAIETFGNANCKTTSQSVLNETEQTNFRLIRAAEKAKRCETPTTTIAAAGPKVVSAAPPRSDPTRVNVCDTTAGAEWDTDKKSAGLDFRRLDPSIAIDACVDAVREQPGERRLWFQLGRAHDKARNYAIARQAYLQAANLGSGAAMVNLGILFEKGQGVARNARESRVWYERAARTNVPMGAFCYATALDNGLGGPIATNEALQYYERAASAGYAPARAALAKVRQGTGPTGTRCD